MDKQERLARQWAEKYLRYADESDSAELYAAAQVVKAHITPLTMADVKWVKELHYLAGVTTKNGTELMMLDIDEDLILTVNPDTADQTYFDGYELTPNGKRYELREVTEQEHPVVLEMLNDYDAAPEGTIVATAHGVPWVKEVGEWWVGDRPVTSESIAYQPRFVLRWGWGK